MNDKFKAPFLGAAYYPEDWPEKTMDQDIDMMKKGGLNVMRIGEFAWSVMEPRDGEFDFSLIDKTVARLADAGIATILGTPTATPPAWLYNKHDIAAVRQTGLSVQHGNRRHACSRNPHFIRYALRIVREMAQRYGHDPNIAAWQLDNEIYVYSRDEGCYCPYCRKGFPVYLKEKYKTIEQLNDAWCTNLWSQTYNSFEEIPAPIGYHHPALRAEWLTYQAEGHIEFLKMQADVIRQYSDIPLGTDTMPLGLIDYEKLAEFCDIMEFNHYNEVNTTRRFSFWFNYLRGLKKPFLCTETCTCWGDGVANNMNLKPDGWCTVNTYMAIMFGGFGNLYWLWRSHRAGHELMHGSVISSTGQPLHIFDEVRSIADSFAVARDFLTNTEVVTDGVAIHYTTHAWTTFMTQPIVAGFDYSNAITGFYMAVCENGVTPDIIGAKADLSDYRVIFTPYVPSLEDGGLSERIRRWVEDGGTWIVGPMSDIRNQYGGKFTDHYTGIVEEMTGITFDYLVFDRYAQLDMRFADGQKMTYGTYIDVLSAEHPLVTIDGGCNRSLIGKSVVAEATYGKGKVIVLGTLPDNAALSRIVRSVCRVQFEHSKSVLTALRRGNGTEGVIVAEFDGAKDAWIDLPSPMTELVSKKRYEGHVELKPFDLLILKK